MGMERECRRRMMRRGHQCNSYEQSNVFKNSKGGVLRNSFLMENNRKRGAKLGLTKLMAFSLFIQLAILAYELLLQSRRIKSPVGIFGSNIGPESSASLPDKQIPPIDVIKSNMQEDHTETSATNNMKSFPPASAIKSNPNHEQMEKAAKSGLRSASPLGRGGSPTDAIKSITKEENTTGMRSISRIDKDYPSADAIKSILTEEQQMVSFNNGLYTHPLLSLDNERHTIDDMAAVYELLYAFIAAFQREDIPIFLGFGSHLGARRHHGIIPFSEKDIDLQVFSVNERQVTSIVHRVLQSNESWSNILVERDEFGFGYRLNKESMAKHGFKYYIEFWLFDSNVGNDKNVVCIGRTNLPGKRNKGKTGCSRSYMHYAGVYPPKFEYSDYFPPLYQVFGSHKVPIPRTSRELETFDYNGAEEHWNTTCGSHRGYDSITGRWVNVPKEERECSSFYDKYPFVFKTGGGAEELRQGDVVIHRSELET